MWNPAFKDGYEARKCRYRVASYCRGLGLDISAEKEKITKQAIALYELGGNKQFFDLSANNALAIFSDNFFEYVFDSHQLNTFRDYKAPLEEWWRVIKAGGHLILYEKDRDYYPNVGTPGAPNSHNSDFYWQDVWSVLKSFGNAELVSATRHNDSNEYSWQLIVKKKYARVKKPLEIIKSNDRKGYCVLPRKKKSEKEVLVIRYGALGDTIWITPVLKLLKQDGYRVIVNTTEMGSQVLKENPYVDEFIIHEEGTDVPYEELETYWKYLGSQFDKIINLTKSVEGSLIKVEGSAEFFWPHEQRHKECNYNFQDRTMELAGYSDQKGLIPELHFSEMEEYLAKSFYETHKDKFIILWGLAGSAFHKVYPWAEYVANEINNRYRTGVLVITVGDDACKILEWSNPTTLSKCGVWTVRQSYIMAKYANLVIGPDTGLMNAASCFDTPKIVFMSANSIENLTKYWKNTTALWADNCECYPCHRLIYTNSCPRGTVSGVAPKCMENIKPEIVMAAVDKYYQQWKIQRTQNNNQKKIIAFTIADDELTHRLAKRTMVSFKKYHPDIEFRIYDPADEFKILGEIKNSACACKSFEIRPRLCKKLLEECDAVIYLDADTVVTGRLDEFLTCDYHVAGSMNLDFGDKDMLNAGVSAITSLQFCQEWTDMMYRPDSGTSNQVYYNQLARNGRYCLKIVDKDNVYYNETSRPYWGKIERKDGQIWVNDRQIKVLHWAGGSGRMESKLSSKDFSQPVRNFLNDITETTDFTDIEGEVVSKWDAR